MKLTISKKLINDEREIRIGRYVAYGTIDDDGTYALIHAPTQDDLNAVATVMDGLESHDIEALLARAGGRR